MWRQIIAPSCAALLVVSLAACGAGTGTGTGTAQTKSYGDGRLGISDTNPNLPTSPTYHTYKADAQMVRQALKPVQGIRSSSVQFQGANAIVNLKAADGTNEKDKQRIKAEVKEAVSKMMPRYHVIVTVK
jgi:hypothetical protein